MKEIISILVVDDEDSIRKRCVQLLSRQGYHVVGIADSMTAFKMMRGKINRFDMMLVDIRMPGMDGIELLEKIKEWDPSVEVIMMTGYATVDTAVKAMRMGAYDYLSKPFEIDELLHVIRRVVEKKLLQREVLDLRKKLKEQQDPPFLLGSSAAMYQVSKFIQKVAPVDCNILLYGESGTGKELVARALHANSPRKDGPFVVADCAALSGSLLESELFGHLKGAFTGAHTTRKGYFESADHGTLFLDEIGELPLDLQGKLLRAVQERVVAKVGDTQQIKVDIRIIAATNRNIETLVAEQAFREDLFYRLNVVAMTIPPLRERREDIPLLATHFLKRQAARLSGSDIPQLSREILERLTSYDWPGNVRELENAIHRAVVLADAGKLEIEHLIPQSGSAAKPSVDANGKPLTLRELRQQVVRDFTLQHLENCLRFYNGNITRAAKELGMRRTSLQRLLKQSNLESRDFRKGSAS